MSVSLAEAAIALEPKREEQLQQHEQKQASGKSRTLPPSFSQLAIESAGHGWCRRLFLPNCDIPYDGAPPPDGGVRAWSQVLAGHLVLLSTWGYVNSFGWFQAHYIIEFDLPASDISWIVSLMLFMLTSLASVSGRLFDAGYYRPLTIVGFSAQILGIFTTSVASKYWQAFLAQGVCGGIANACMWAPHMSLTSTWFLKRRSFALALMLCGTSTGGVIWTVIAQQLEPVIGFRWTVRVMGFIVIACFAAVLALARTRVAPRDGGPFFELAAFKERSYVLFVVGTFLVMFAVYTPFFYINQYASNVIHVNAKTSLAMIYLMNGVSIFGRLLPALIADAYIGPVWTYQAFALSCGIVLLSWIAVHNLAGLIVFSSIFGFFGSGVQGLLGAAFAYLTKDLQKLGIRIGMVFSIGSVPVLCGSPLVGALIHLHGGNYLYAQIFGGLCMIIGSGFILAAAIALRRQSDRS